MRSRYEEKWVLVSGKHIAFYLLNKNFVNYRQYDIKFNDYYLLDVTMVDEQPHITKIKNFSKGGKWIDV